MIRWIVWDWNGTLLDDVDSTVGTLNTLLEERRMAPVTREQYRARFGFPVRAFYEDLGFDFVREDFAGLSVSFIERYRQRAAHMAVAPGTLAVLEAVRARGVRQLVVSAMESRLLATMLSEHGVTAFLDGHHGTADVQAGSKVAVGVAALRARGLSPGEVLVVGDTLHDHELATEAGSHAALYGGGHQTRARLDAAAGPRGGVRTTVVDCLDDVLGLLD